MASIGWSLVTKTDTSELEVNAYVPVPNPIISWILFSALKVSDGCAPAFPATLMV